jgi:hypothetical protein
MPLTFVKGSLASASIKASKTGITFSNSQLKKKSICFLCPTILKTEHVTLFKNLKTKRVLISEVTLF